MPDGMITVETDGCEDWGGSVEPGALVQLAELREKAKVGGLRFVAYLPPGLADWSFDQIEDGLFADPQEAVFAIVGIYRDLEPHMVVREQLLRRACAASVFDTPQPLPPGDDVENKVRTMLDNPPATAAIWRRKTVGVR